MTSRIAEEEVGEEKNMWVGFKAYCVEWGAEKEENIANNLITKDEYNTLIKIESCEYFSDLMYKIRGDENEAREVASLLRCYIEDRLLRGQEEKGKRRIKKLEEKIESDLDTWLYDEIARQFRMSGYGWKEAQRKADVILREKNDEVKR
jgi:hypothetical protein